MPLIGSVLLSSIQLETRGFFSFTGTDVSTISIELEFLLLIKKYAAIQIVIIEITSLNS